MAENNPIPSIRAAGRFEAKAPFDVVVDKDKYYTVEAVRTIPEMEGLKIDVYSRVFKPIGLTVEDYPAVLERAKSQKAVVITLTDRAGTPTYVVSSYLTSFPVVDGVSYERMCVVVDLGPCDPSMRDIIQPTLDHFKSYVEATVGITTNPVLGTIPTLGYVSKAQHDALEANRKSKIIDSSSDVVRNRELEAQIIQLKNYIADLEARLED